MTSEVPWKSQKVTLSTTVPISKAVNHTKIIAHAGPWGGKKGSPMERYSPAYNAKASSTRLTAL